MSFVNKRSIDSITIAGQTIVGGEVEINMPGATADPVTGEIVLPSGGGIVESFTLDASDITNKYVVLGSAPSDKASTKIDVKGFSPQFYGDDFIVTNDDGGKRVSWNGLGLESLLIAGDKLTITYS